MATWTSLTDNQLVDHTALQDAVTTSVFNLKAGQTIPTDLECSTTLDAYTLVDIRREILPVDDNKYPMKSEFQRVILFPVDEAGIVVADIYHPSAVINAIGYFDTPGVTIANNPVYTGINFSPDPDTAPANCWMLAGDSADFSGNTGYRFQFNVAKILVNYPLINTIVMKVAARANSVITAQGGYSIKTANDSIMTMSGSISTYQPGVANDNAIGGTLYSYSLAGGADGSHDPAILPVVKTFTYDRSTKVLSVS